MTPSVSLACSSGQQGWLAMLGSTRLWAGHGVASGRRRPQQALVLWPDCGWPYDGTPCRPRSHRPGRRWRDATAGDGQTLQPLIEHDPVSQRLDQLRLDARLSPCTRRMTDTRTPSAPWTPRRTWRGTRETPPEVPRSLPGSVLPHAQPSDKWSWLS